MSHYNGFMTDIEPSQVTFSQKPKPGKLLHLQQSKEITAILNALIEVPKKTSPQSSAKISWRYFGILSPCPPINELIKVFMLVLCCITNIFIVFSFAYLPGKRQGSLSEKKQAAVEEGAIGSRGSVLPFTQFCQQRQYSGTMCKAAS